MIDPIIEYLIDRGPYLLFVALFILGFFLLVAHRNYLQAVTGLYLAQTGIILFFVLIAARLGGTIPIRTDDPKWANVPLHNPLPHALVLTAIVVGVATLGVAVAILRRVQYEAGSIDESTAGDADD